MYCLYRDVLLTRTSEIVGTGWLPPMPDLRDYTPESPVIAEMSQQLGVTDAVGGLKATPPTVDLRAWCSPVENQGALGSCTANAAVGGFDNWGRRRCLGPGVLRPQRRTEGRGASEESASVHRELRVDATLP